MKNHPVNNDYVQNLQESLINEISKGAPLKEPLVKGGPKKKDPSPYAKGGPTKKPEGLVGGETIKDKNSYSGLSDGEGNPVRIGGNGSGSYEGATKPKKFKLNLQKESFDIADSRLTPEEAKIDQNVKTRGIKKVRGQKPVPMTNSRGETIGQQNSGVRPRSQDLNTRGRLNQSREGEGMLAKGKRFIKKKFA